MDQEELARVVKTTAITVTSRFFLGTSRLWEQLCLRVSSIYSNSQLYTAMPESVCWCALSVAVFAPGEFATAREVGVNAQRGE